MNTREVSEVILRPNILFDRDALLLVKNCCRNPAVAIVEGKHLPVAKVTRWMICFRSEHVWECCRTLEIDVEYNRRGFVAPADFAGDANVKGLAVLKAENPG